MAYDDPAAYLAGRIRAKYPLSDPPTVREVLSACFAEGAMVVARKGLCRAGVYLPWPEPVIIVRFDAGARVLAHELYHHLVSQNEQHGIIYTYPEFLECETERAAERFAEILCGGRREK